MRLALSCLVDADHTDSATFEYGHVPPAAAEPRWADRLEALNQYVSALPMGDSPAEQERNRQRRDFYHACMASPISDPVVACQGPVGIGKTTAVSAYLIRRARDEGLRRLFIIAPYTNIISQTARDIRKALVLSDEQPDRVIVEHHHRADFSNKEDRSLAVLWRAPIILTTAVAFFETLAACDPGALRKLHAVPGSAIFVDEAHAALPVRLWRQHWAWLRELANEWGCRIVFASGSLAKWWERQEIVGQPVALPELMPLEQLKTASELERGRVRYAQAGGGAVLSVAELTKLVTASPGPRLLVLNTVQNAAVVAKAMRDAGHDVLHLSTALTPRDRAAALRKIEKRLACMSKDRNWTLVATSCIEAGVNLSFRCAFRERFAVASTLQVGGRVNRHSEYQEAGGGTVYDFALSDTLITQHPGARVSADILREFLAKDLLNNCSPAETVTYAMVEEINRYGGLRSDPLSEAEKARDYPGAHEASRVIDADTRFVVVDRQLIGQLERGAPVGWRELLEGSVQLWARHIDRLGLKAVAGHRDIYIWTDQYDSFLGYMSGALAKEALISGDNGAWIVA